MDSLESSILDPDTFDSDQELDAKSEYLFRPPRLEDDETPRAPRKKEGMTMRTGPKGVLADWRGSSEAHSDVQPTTFALSSQERNYDDDERVALAQYRLRRLAELKATGAHGHLREIGIDQFQQAVIEEDADVKVVLLLYEPDVMGCTLLSRHLSFLAHSYPRAKFVRARASELDFKAHHDVLPTLLVYQGGELVESLVAIDREWEQRPDVSEETVKEILKRYGIF